MPLMMSVMDDLSGKGYPVIRTYLEMWSRLRDEQFLTLNRPEEMAFHAGFEGNVRFELGKTAWRVSLTSGS